MCGLKYEGIQQQKRIVAFAQRRKPSEKIALRSSNVPVRVALFAAAVQPPSQGVARNGQRLRIRAFAT